MSHIFLSWWETLLLRLLIRSSRIGTIVVRQYNTNIHWVLMQEGDPFLASSEPEASPPWDVDEPESPSMLLERLFHEPDAAR